MVANCRKLTIAVPTLVWCLLALGLAGAAYAVERSSNIQI